MTKQELYDLILVSLLDDWCNGAYDQDTKRAAELHSEQLSLKIMKRLVPLISSSPDETMAETIAAVGSLSIPK